jgi:hypothetical protein
MSPKSAQRFWDNDMRKNKSLEHDADPITRIVL